MSSESARQPTKKKDSTCFVRLEEKTVWEEGELGRVFRDEKLINRGAVEEGPAERVGKYGGRSDIGPVRGTDSKRRQSSD